MTSWTEMQTYMRCPRAWELSYVERIEARAVEDKVNLIRGRAFHKVMESHLLGHNRQEIAQILRIELSNVQDLEIRGAINDEVQNLYEYHHNQIYMPASHHLATASDVFPDTHHKLGLDTTTPMVEYSFEFEGFTGVVDAIIYDASLKAHVIVDWKLRRTMSHPMDIQVDGQLQFYAACLNKMGANIQAAYMWEFRNAIPKPARINKNGMPSVAAQDTTWEVWWDSLPYPLPDTLDKAEWQETLTGKVKGKEEYSKAHDIPITPNSSKLAMDNATTIEAMIGNALFDLEQGQQMPAWLSSFGCRFCEFNKLCASPLQYGDDPTEMIAEHYQEKVRNVEIVLN